MAQKFKKNSRRKYLINRPFQLYFIAYNVGVSVIVSAVFYASIRFFFWKLQSFGLQAGLPSDNVFFVFISEQVSLMNAIFFFCSTVIALILAVHGLFLSHKIAGPLYHLRVHMEQVARKERMDSVHFRKNDMFRELEDAYNRQLETLKEKQRAA